jgi:hypothetical protein
MKKLPRWWSKPKTKRLGSLSRAGNLPRNASIAAWITVALFWFCVPLSAYLGGGIDWSSNEAQERYDQAQPGQCYATPAGNVACKFASPDEEESIPTNTAPTRCNSCEEASPRWGRPIEMVGAAFVGLTLAVLVWQVCVLRKQTEANITSANAARQSADIADANLRHLERPYIVLDPIACTPSNQQYLAPFELILDFVYRNAGRTPALMRKVFIDFDFADALPQTPTYRTTGKPNMFGTLIPGETSKIIGHRSHAVTGQPEMNRLRSQQTAFITYGFIQYKDIFGKEHITGFGFRYDFGRNKMADWGDDPYNYYT